MIVTFIKLDKDWRDRPGPWWKWVMVSPTGSRMEMPKSRRCRWPHTEVGAKISFLHFARSYGITEYRFAENFDGTFAAQEELPVAAP